jgi:putative two-component system response regulator
MIVDDEPANTLVLERLLAKAGATNVTALTDARQALLTFVEYQPDLLLLDLMMPYLDGFQVMRQLQQVLSPDSYLPILVLTADITPTTKARALAEGAHDFLTKPFEVTEVILRINNLLRTRGLALQLQRHNERLEETVAERTQELEDARLQILNRLTIAAEYRDDQTGLHAQRVGQLSALLGSSLGLGAQEVTQLRRAAPLHDLGKIGIPDAILLKPGRLTPEERSIMERHSEIGARILAGGDVPILRMAETIALTHHERWDGQGYPRKLAGEDIPQVGRIVAVADVFDALTHERPYKPAWTRTQALTQIEQQRGQHFDPQVVTALLKLAHGAAFPAEPGADQALTTPALVPPPALGQRLWKERHAAGLLEPLTPREREVLAYLAQGHTNREIAATLMISAGTVKLHVEHILAKLEVPDRTRAAVRALELGLLSLESE